MCMCQWVSLPETCVCTHLHTSTHTQKCVRIFKELPHICNSSDSLKGLSSYLEISKEEGTGENVKSLKSDQTL